MARWILGGVVVLGGLGALIPLGVQAAYWLGYLDPVIPHYLNEAVLRVWPTAAWLMTADDGGTARAVLVLSMSIIFNAVIYALVGAVLGAVLATIRKKT